MGGSEGGPTTARRILVMAAIGAVAAALYALWCWALLHIPA